MVTIAPTRPGHAPRRFLSRAPWTCIAGLAFASFAGPAGALPYGEVQVTRFFAGYNCPVRGSWALTACGLLALALRRRLSVAMATAALGLTFASTGALALTPNLHIDGYATASLSNPLPGLEGQGSFDYVAASGALSDGVLVDGGVYDDPPYTGAQALASARFGALSVLAGAEVTSGAAFGDYLTARAEARAGWSDWITITPHDPTLLFTTGTMEFQVAVVGTGSVLDTTTQGDGTASFRVSTISGVPDAVGIWSTSVYNPVGLGTYQGPPLPFVLAGERRFYYGVPFTIGVEMSAGVDISATRDGHIEAYVDLLHTVTWDGITSVVTSSGDTLTEYDLASVSGTDWSQPFAVPQVPEPGSWAMMLAGLGLVGWASRRRKVWSALID